MRRHFDTERLEQFFAIGAVALRFVDLVDQAALARRAKIGIPLAKQVLAEMGVIDESRLLV